MLSLKNTINIVFSLFLITSCTLERENYNELAPEMLFQNENDLKLAVNSLYTPFNSGWGGVYAPDRPGYQTFTEMHTDIEMCTWGYEWDNWHWHQWTAEAGNPSVSSHFSRYNYLSTARNMIRRIEQSSVDPKIKNKYIGEAKALRGWMGLYLFDLFGTVPVASDEVLDNPEKFVYLPRLSQEEYDNMMEDDLLYAIENLPESPAERGRLAKGAARMILLKYYMIRGLYEKAESIARDLYSMENKVYSLQPDYNYVFSKKGIGNNEIILQIPSSKSSDGMWVNYIPIESLPADFPWVESAAVGWGGYVMDWDFYDTFEPNDKRKDNIYASYINKEGQLVERENLKGAIALKYGKDEEMLGANCYIDFVIFRFSDVLLTLAECINRNEGFPTQEAIDLVNRVRNRAGLDPLTAQQTATYESFNEALLSERGHEFWFEGLRRQDLIRFGKYIEYANNRINKANKEGNKNYFNIDESHNLFFIPLTYINESQGAIIQNPGY